MYERANGVQPAEEFFKGLSDRVARRLIGYIDNVAKDPVGFPSGPAWQAMHGEAVGCHEVRVRLERRLYRIFVRLDSRPVPGYVRSGCFVLLDGACKSVDEALPSSVYRQVAQMAEDYWRTRRVSPPAVIEGKES